MRTLPTLALGILGTTFGVLGQAPSRPVPPRDGEACPPGRWYVEGGNSARNATSQSPPVLRRPLVAWSQKASGTILGEPLVWDQHVVLAVRVNDKKRALEVRRLVDGALVGPPRVMESTADPSPSLWGNEIVWRSGPEGYELLRIGTRSLDFVARTPKTKGLGTPLRFGTKLFAIVEGHVTCMRVSDFRVLWRSRERGFVGTLSLLDRSVYGLQGEKGSHQLVALDRDTGEATAFAQPAILAKIPGEDLRIQLAGTRGVVRFGSGNLLRDFVAPGIELNSLHVAVPLVPAPLLPFGMPVLHALDGTQHFGTLAEPKGRQLVALALDGQNGVRLDTCELHRRLAEAPPTIAGGVAYFGACAVETGEYRMLWRIDRIGERSLPITRAIPAGRTLLLAAGNELHALREDAPADPIASELHGTWLAAHRKRLSPLVDEAMAAADWDLAADLLARCRGLGADETWATPKEKDITARSKDAKAKRDEAKAARVKTAADATAAAALDEVHAGLAGWTTRPAADQRQALRFLLDQAPGHAGATADVRKLLPKDIQPPEPLLARDWLDFLDAVAHTKIAVLDATLKEFADEKLDSIAAQSKQQLLEWRHKWRKDIQALQSERTLLFSPITRPGSLAKAMATGELVCDALESMFADMPKVRNEPRPMLVFIYPDRDEYLAESKKLGVDSAEWAAGYYSDALNELVPKSRLFVPADDTGFATVLPTLAHELTHQWLMDRCPAFQPDPIAVRMGPKAFWIVEGFASLIGQFEFDLARRQVRFGNGNLEDADMVASAKDRQLIEWGRLTRMSRLEFARMTIGRAEAEIASTMRLGAGYRARRLHLFYAQSAMLCRYLYEAEEGRFKKQLLEFVAAWYSGKTDALDFAKAFGVDAKELGPKVVEFSKRLTQ
jgi:hypothetical protein